MKKILSAAFLSSIFFLLLSFNPKAVFAAPCPPMGTNIAANFDRENLEFIAKNANCDGPIPITVIITPALVQNPALLIELQNNLRDLGFDPTWRPWGYVDPDSPEFQDWLNLFSLLEIGRLQLWNEWNRYTEVPVIDPVRDAKLIQALIDAKNAGLINIPIGNTPLDLFNRTDMWYQDYWRLLNQACPNCLNELDFLAFNVYTRNKLGPNSPQEFLNVLAEALRFLQSLGVDLSTKFFVISEAGLNPGAYDDFNQRLRDTLEFANALLEFVRQNPNYLSEILGIDIDLTQITFLLMDDSTGHQYLIYLVCDDQGNCEWKVTEYLIFNLNVPGSLIPSFPPLDCTPSDSGDPDSRPVPCDACNRTDSLTLSCATPFTVLDEVTYHRGDVDFWCPEENGEPWLERNWGGLVIVDPSQTEIPFVGKKGEEDEYNYLADYFEGTGFYYSPPYDYTKIEDIRRVILEGGVWRKLAPETLQDEFKRQMVDRAIKSLNGQVGNDEPIHDYLVSYNGESETLSQFADHLKPDPDEENFQEKYEEWKESDGGKWYRLWAAVPMFSREDTPGQIQPYLSARPKDSFEIINPEAQIEKVPHVARLREVTRAINHTLLPRIYQALGLASELNKDAKALLASAENKVLGEKVEVKSNQNDTAELLLAQKDPESHGPNDVSMVLVPHGCAFQPLVKVVTCEPGKNIYHVSASCGGNSIFGNLFVISCGSSCAMADLGCPWIDLNNLNEGQSQTVCATVKADVIDCDKIEDATVCCTITKTGPGCDDYESDCTLPGPEPPECGLREPWPQAGPCDRESITDPHPNDNLCCEPIGILLSATDQFINKDYIECGVECLEWNEVTGECKKDACDEIKSQSVSRDVGINLFHPYLEEIWNYSTEDLKGFYNIFKLSAMDAFEAMDAHSNLSYSYSSGGVAPSSGKFYFPYLGGIQLAKEWVIQELTPKLKLEE